MERKEEIILATLELASANGLKSVSMAQIAEKVGIKAPSLYNHFKSKDEIVRTMYGLLRQKAQQNRSHGFADPEAFASKYLEQILTESLSAYLGMVTDADMARFFRVLYSERSINPLAAEIMLEETEHMAELTALPAIASVMAVRAMPAIIPPKTRRPVPPVAICRGPV